MTSSPVPVGSSPRSFQTSYGRSSAQTPTRWAGYIQEMVKTIRGLGGIAITST